MPVPAAPICAVRAAPARDVARQAGIIGRAVADHGFPASRNTRFPGRATPRRPCTGSGPGRVMPSHTHDGSEVTLVLRGGFSDPTGHYRRGDIAIADRDLDHHPRADDDEDCICFAVIDAPLRLTGPLAPLVADQPARPLAGVAIQLPRRQAVRRRERTHASGSATPGRRRGLGHGREFRHWAGHRAGLARRGFTVAATARRREELEALAPEAGGRRPRIPCE